jgi:hypothetical protein
LLSDASIDIRPDSTLYDEVVGRFLKIIILLMVVAAVTTILITPTASDDVPGLMHRNHSPVAVVVTVGLVQLAALTKWFHRLQDRGRHQLLCPNFLELVCQHLC